MGNHAFDREESFSYFNSEPRIIRPANYSDKTPGRGVVVREVFSGVKIAVVNLIGRIHMEPVDCPFAAADRVLAELHGEADIIFVDMHAEATSETRAMGWYLDGKVAAVLGSHTHVPTADEEILPAGTAYLTDAGMTGPYRSVIGMEVEAVLKKFRSGIRSKFEPAKEDVRFCGAVVEIEESTGLARKIERVTKRLER
jgi:metallophosphoesterase (TIGR00282 family)